MLRSRLLPMFWLIVLPIAFTGRLLAQDSLWTRSLGGNQNDRITSQVVDAEGLLWVVGSTSSTSGDVDTSLGGTDVWVTVLDVQSGDTLWTRSYGGSGHDEPLRVLAADADGVFVLGHSTSNNGQVAINRGLADGWVLRLSSQGQVLWSRTYGGTGQDLLLGGWKGPGTFLYAVGTSSSIDNDLPNRNLATTPSSIGWLLVLDPSSGNLVESRTYANSSTPAAMDELRDVLINPITGNVALVGSTGNFAPGGDVNLWYLRLNSGYFSIANRAFGGAGRDEGRRIFFGQAGNDSYILAGNTSSSGGDVVGYKGGASDYWACRVDNQGNLSWSRAVGGADADVLLDAAQDSLGFVYLFGYSRSDVGADKSQHPINNSNDAWLAKLHPQTGQLRWDMQFGGSAPDAGSALCTDPQGLLLLGVQTASADGLTTQNQGLDDYWLARVGLVLRATDSLVLVQEEDSFAYWDLQASSLIRDTLLVKWHQFGGNAQPFIDYIPSPGLHLPSGLPMGTMNLYLPDDQLKEDDSLQVELRPGYGYLVDPLANRAWLRIGDADTDTGTVSTRPRLAVQPVLYPNPAQHAAELSGLPFSPENYTLTATSANGQQVWLQPHNGGTPIALPVAEWPAGLYVLQVVHPTGQWQARLAVVR